jgi:hypothetical protein
MVSYPIPNDRVVIFSHINLTNYKNDDTDTGVLIDEISALDESNV